MKSILAHGSYIFYLLKNSKDIEYADYKIEQARFLQLILKNHLFTVEELNACGHNVRKLEMSLNKDDTISQLSGQHIAEYAQKL